MANELTTQVVNIDTQSIAVMADAVAKSGLFGLKTKEQAMALMLVAQAEGRHPASAAKDYHIINNTPSKKAEAMLRDFLLSGGVVKWHVLNDDKAEATFSHPQGGEATFDWTIARANKAGVGSNPMWKKYPRAMLRSRVVSEGVRTIYPAATSGMYVPEEVQDFAPSKAPKYEPPKDAIDVETTPATNSRAAQLSDEVPDFDKKPEPKPAQEVPLTDQAKAYAELIKGALFVGELDNEVLMHVPLMARLLAELPAWHARLLELITQKRAEFVDTVAEAVKPRKRTTRKSDDVPAMPISDETELNDPLPPMNEAERIAKTFEKEVNKETQTIKREDMTHVS